MAVPTSETTISYAGVSFGGSTARQITEWTVDEHDFVNGSFEFEFVTTAATDSAFATELNTVRNAFRTPRQDLLVSQNTGGGATTILSRYHSVNTGLDTFPHIIKDGDPADTGRSRHFRVRIEYKLPADTTNTSFRQGLTMSIQYSPSRRRTVTFTGTYTANSTNGTTASDTQYFDSITAAETSFLSVIDSSATWERVSQGPISTFETRKNTDFVRVYREVNVPQSLAGDDNSSIIDPHMEISVQQIAPGDSLESGLTFDGGGTGGATTTSPGAGSGINGTVTMGAPPGTPTSTGTTSGIKRPVFITINYEADINFDDVENSGLPNLWTGTIRPWILDRANQFKVASSIILVDETPAYEIYENRIAASMKFIAYYAGITKQKITYREVVADGYILLPTTSRDVFSYYEFPGPAVRQAIITEEREETVGSGMTSRAYTQKLYVAPGAFSTQLGDSWRKVSREPQAYILTQGRDIQQTIAYATIVTVFQFRNLKTPSTADAGGVTGANLT